MTKSTTPRPSRFLLRRKRGWIGVDVGAALTKMAQVERVGGAYHIAARWCLPAGAGHGFLDDLHQADAELDIFQQLRQGRSVFRGKRAAAALTAGLTTHRCLELPASHDDDLRRMIGEEIESDAPAGTAERCFDYWQTVSATNGNNAMVQLSVVDADRSVSLRVAHNLSRAGLDCRVLDGMPCALARALQILSPNETESPQIILDIGHSSTVFVAAVGGVPEFTRVLRGCGMDAILQPIQTSMPLTASESLQLVRRVGLFPVEHESPSDGASHVIHQLISEPVARLMGEITRTLGYLQNGVRALVPEQLVLSGGGAYLPHLASRLAEETGLETVPWKLPAANSSAASQDDALFAVAAALSALAWEA